LALAWYNWIILRMIWHFYLLSFDVVDDSTWRVQRLSNALSLLTLTCSCCCSDIAIGYLIYYGHVLLYLMGSEGREIYNTINFERSEEERKVEDVLKGLKDYCISLVRTRRLTI
jgi:hypothetical protein